MFLVTSNTWIQRNHIILFVYVFQKRICHEGIMSRHRGVNGTLDKLQRTLFVLSAWDKIRRFVERCNICLTKERSIKSKMGPHVPSTVGNIDKKVFIDLVILSETMRKNCYLLTVQDGFTRFASAYLICNKEAGTVARVLICEQGIVTVWIVSCLKFRADGLYLDWYISGRSFWSMVFTTDIHYLYYYHFIIIIIIHTFSF